MNFQGKDLELYLVTDRTWTKEESLMDQVRKALDAGITFLQLREKELDYEAFVKEAKEMGQLARNYKVLFVINDNVEVALACQCDGVHIGQDDMPVEKARQLIGKDKILGVSVGSVEQALLAEKQGADYLGVGAMFTTGTKPDANDISLETLKAICEAVRIPVVAIGGIGKDNIHHLEGSGIKGVAVVSAILASPDIAEATDQLKTLTTQYFK